MVQPAVTSVGTPVKSALEGPESFTFVNAASNTTNIHLSTVDQRCLDSFDTLVPGENKSYEDFEGTLYARGASGGELYSIEDTQKGRALALKSR